MKIGFNARLLSDSTLRGWNRYTINLLASLAPLGVELFLYSDQPVHAGYLSRLPAGSFYLRQSPAMNYFLWEQRWLPSQAGRDGVAVLHCPLNFGLPFACPCPRVLTLHDAIGQTAASGRLHWTKRLGAGAFKTDFAHWVARTSAEHVITVSEHSKKDLVRFLRLKPEKISVIYEAADARFSEAVSRVRRETFRHKQGLTKPYFFYVGGWEERKNVEFLVRAFARAALPDVELVLAGGESGQKAAMLTLAKSLNVVGRVRFLPWIDDEDLVLFYAEALCFVYPSRYEGFGLQLCEAMAAGCAVLAANSTSLPEVLGDGGETFALDSPDNLSAKLRRMVTDSMYHERLRDSASKRSAFFSWEKTAAETLALYRRCSEQKSRDGSQSLCI